MKTYKLTEQVEKWRKEKKNEEREVGSFARENLQEAEDIMEELLYKIEELRDEE